ncbi:hypothetical protein ACLOJK_034209 [Asimina triloba]
MVAATFLDRDRTLFNYSARMVLLIVEWLDLLGAPNLTVGRGEEEVAAGAGSYTSLRPRQILDGAVEVTWICRMVLSVVSSRRTCGRCRYRCLDGVEAVDNDWRRKIWNEHVYAVVFLGSDQSIGFLPEDPLLAAMDDDGGAPY